MPYLITLTNMTLKAGSVAVPVMKIQLIDNESLLSPYKPHFKDL